jgi:hypothetical protein
VWWHTSGAAVLQTTNVCSLFMYTDTQAVIFTWNADGVQRIDLQDPRFDFATDERVAVIVQVDGTTLASDLGYGVKGHMLAVPVQSLDLSQATEISATVSTTNINYTMTMSLNTAKLPVLLTAVDKCRAKLS